MTGTPTEAPTRGSGLATLANIAQALAVVVALAFGVAQVRSMRGRGHGEVDLALLDAFYSGSIVHSWYQLRRMVEEARAESSRDTRWEWFQWLAERMIEHQSSTPPEPAYRARRKWSRRP